MAKVTIQKEVEQTVHYGDTLFLKDGSKRLLAKVSDKTVGIRDNGLVGTRKNTLQDAVSFYDTHFGIKQVTKGGSGAELIDEATFTGIQDIEIEVEVGDMLKLGDGTYRLIVKAGHEYVTWNPYGNGYLSGEPTLKGVVDFYRNSTEFGGIVGVVKQPLQGKDS